jgi:2-oxoglutarate dehydrogenase E1 component
MSSSQHNNIFKKTSFLAGDNSAFIEELYFEYLQDPKKLPKGWKEFFDGLNDNKEVISKTLEGPSWAPKKKIKKDKLSLEDLLKEDSSESNKVADHPLTEESAKNSIRAIMLVRAFRIRGHLIANLDPLELMAREEHPELKPETYGFTKSDFNKKIFLDGVLGLQEATLLEIITILKKTYSGNIGYEFMHMGDPNEKNWIRDRIEGPEKKVVFTENGKKAILNKIIEAEGFEKYLHVKFVGTKRFGIDGGESLVPALEQIIKKGGNLGVKEIKIGMSHRGRLNVNHSKQSLMNFLAVLSKLKEILKGMLNII